MGPGGSGVVSVDGALANGFHGVAGEGRKGDGHDHGEARQGPGDGQSALVGAKESKKSIKCVHSCAVNDYRRLEAARGDLSLLSLTSCPSPPRSQPGGQVRERGSVRPACISRSWAPPAGRASPCAGAPAPMKPIRATPVSRFSPARALSHGSLRGVLLSESRRSHPRARARARGCPARVSHPAAIPTGSPSGAGAGRPDSPEATKSLLRTSRKARPAPTRASTAAMVAIVVKAPVKPTR